MKTHNYVFVTLAIKNVIMAAPLNDAKGNDKGLMHQAPPARNDLLHYNMLHIAHEIFPDLAVIDGYVGIEGNGPAWGVPIGSKVALASRDAVAADVTGTRVMGFDPRMINYLNAMAAAGGAGRLRQDQAGDAARAVHHDTGPTKEWRATSYECRSAARRRLAGLLRSTPSPSGSSRPL
jgi:uncharacterized protein (DUF362 family)